tara:strand:- start:493 stop:1344 length:852 start_codon:yes stop_codon:yes gene_type:complete
MINPFKQKRGLGRGLSSLIGDSSSSSKKNKISVSSIIRNKYQPRKNFNKESLEDLTNSIKERGIIQPIIVRKSKTQDNKFEIVAGERRWLAAQNAGLHEVPIVEVDVDDLKSLEFAIVENVQRHDLNPMEEAQGYQRLIDEFNYDQEKVAKFIGKNRTHITNSLRILSLPEDVINLIEKGKLSLGHAKVLVGLENSYIIANKIIDKKLSVRQAENLIRIIKNPKKFKVSKKDPNINNLENILKEKLGIDVFIKNRKNNRGSITFEYKDIDQLNRLITVIKSNY